MKNYLIAVLCLSLTFSLSSQNLKNKYTFRANEQGSVYFIHSLDGFECKELKKDKKLEYDVTVVSFKDSVTLNFTYKNPNPSPLDSVHIISGNKSDIKIGSRMLYVKPHKKRMGTARLPLNTG